MDDWIQSESGYFCCDGCHIVYELLDNADLCSYYDRADRAGISMRLTPDISAYDVLDDPAVQRILIDFRKDNILTVTFAVPTIHCASCVWLLERLPQLDCGVRSATVDVIRKTVRVVLDTGVTSVRSVAVLLAQVGYAPAISGERPNESVRADLRTLYLRLGVAGFAMGNVMLFAIARYLAGPSEVPTSIITTFNSISLILSVPVLLFSAAPWFISSMQALRNRALNLDVPVALGIAALFVRSVIDITTGFTEGFLDSFNGLVFFLLIGRLFQQKAFDAVSFDRTWRSFFPLSVRRVKAGIAETVSVSNIHPGDILEIRHGEVIPCDSVLTDSVAYVDYSFVTGESIPVELTSGSMLFAGGRVAGSALRCTVVKDVSHGYLASIWERLGTRKPRMTMAKLSDRFGMVFTIGAISLAVIAAIVRLPDWSLTMSVFSAVLIIACPCALTISSPIALGTAMGRLARRSIYLRNVSIFPELARTDTVIFDKTGTLTQSSPTVQSYGSELSDWQAVAIASVASQSTHPMSRMIVRSLPKVNLMEVSLVDEVPGGGVKGQVAGHNVMIGSYDFVKEGADILQHDLYIRDANVFAAIDSKVVAAYTFNPVERTGICETLITLSRKYCLQLLSGDTQHHQPLFSALFGPSNAHFGCTPVDKVEHIEKEQRKGRHVLMVGDGLNDAAAMNAADAAIAVTDETATITPSCDVIMSADSIVNLPALLDVSRKLQYVTGLNFMVSVVYNIIGLTMAVLGILGPLAVAILMPLSSLSVIGIAVSGARYAVRKAPWKS